MCTSILIQVNVNSKYISPDFVGTTRSILEQELNNSPAMFSQGFCSDVNCYYFFGTPDHAKKTGSHLADSILKYLPNAVPARTLPLELEWQNTTIHCRPMYTAEEIKTHRQLRLEFIESLEYDIQATWVDGYNLPDQMSKQDKINSIKAQLAYLDKAEEMINKPDEIPNEMELNLGVLRIGDTAVFLAPGGNFTSTSLEIRRRSPFANTLIVGETNGIFGYMGPDEEIKRGGYETDVAWKVLPDGEFRLAPALGTVQKVISASEKLLWEIQRK